MKSMFAALILLAALPALANDIPAQWKAAWPKTDFSRISVDPAEIFSGGPPKDGIPAIDNPVMIPASDPSAFVTPTTPKPFWLISINASLIGVSAAIRGSASRC